MKLCKQVLIASAEQAEAMPDGTVALRSWGHGTTARTLNSGRWITPSGAALPHAEVVGFTALVPIEAKEETMRRPSTPLGDVQLGTDLARYVTEWKGVT